VSIITKIQKQTAVYWAPSSVTEFDAFGKPVVIDPVQLKCRWDEVNEEFVAPDGTRQVSRAKVFIESDVELGGVLMLGTLTEAEASGFADDPKEEDGAWEIRAFRKIGNLKATEFLRIAFL